MTASNDPIFVIVNPASSGGSTGARWPRIADCLRRHVRFHAVLSEYPGHAISLGKLARERGHGRVACVGGDGTLNEVVNGLLAGDAGSPLPYLGIVPSGTGSDFARALGIPHGIEEACRRLAAPRAISTDLGVVSYIGDDGGPASRYFVNAAGLGYDAEVVSRRNGIARHARGTVPYLVSLALTLLTYRNKDVAVTLDSAEERRRINALVLAIGSHFGGGMRIAPGAVLDDGLFDVITIGDANPLELIQNLPRVYRGTHLRHPKVRADKASMVRVNSDQPMLVQADGELLGRAPAQFQLIPRALTFLC